MAKLNINQRFWFWLLIVILVNCGYRLLCIPLAEDWSSYTLSLTPYSQELFENLLQTEPWRVFLPLDQGGGGRYAWNPAKSLPVFFLSKILSPAELFIFLTSLMVGTLYTVAYLTTRSYKFAVSLAMIAALSTFLNYSFIYGSLMRNYLFIAYIALSALCIIKYLQCDQKHARKWYVAFLASMVFVVFSGELWVNLGVSFLLGGAYILFWARKHSHSQLAQRMPKLMIFIAISLVLFIGVRLKYSQSMVQPGFESELVLNYPSFLLMIEDMLVNYVTYVYITFSGVLPGFLTFSPSYTFLGPEVISAGQNGYHEAYTHHVINSHLTSWRFVAGVILTLTILWGGRLMLRTWKQNDARALVTVMLFVIIMTGFATYIPIKMRPMHLTAMLGYKTIMSSTALMVLLAWLTYCSESWEMSKRAQNGFVTLIMASVFIAAFTRPMAQAKGLNAVGLSSGGDPLVKIQYFIKGRGM